MPDPIEAFLADLDQRARPLYREMSEAYWRSSLTGTKEDEEKAARAETGFRRLYNSADELRQLREASTRLAPGTDAARQVTILINEFTSNQMDPALLEETVRRQRAIETAFNTFRAQVGDRRLTANEVSQVLRESTDSEERRRVWEASKEVGALVSGPLLELVGIRNEIAHDLGYPDYYRMALELQELTATELAGICDRFEQLTTQPFRTLRQEMDEALARRFNLREEQLRPWHFADPFFQEAPATGQVDLEPLFRGRNIEEIATAFYAGLGLSVKETLSRSDLYEREGKDQHAYCIHLDRAGDVRILCNLRPTTRWVGTLLHECGHAVYDEYLAKDLPFHLRTPAHTFATEAIANLMGRQAREIGWLRSQIGLPAGLEAQIQKEGRSPLRSQMLVTTRWMLVMIHFERELYSDPSQDLNRLWWDLAERFQILRRPEGRNRPDWASKLHLACAPVYYHNYLLGEFMASQLRSWIDREILQDGSDTMAGSPAAGRFLKEKIFAPGARYRWDELLRRATGESLNPEYFVRQFV